MSNWQADLYDIELRRCDREEEYAEAGTCRQCGFPQPIAETRTNTLCNVCREPYAHIERMNERKSALVVEFDAVLTEFEWSAIDRATRSGERDADVDRADARARLLALYRQALDA